MRRSNAHMHSRPLPVTVAAIVQALFSLLSLPGPLLPGSEGVPAVVLYSGILLGVVGLVASAGLWMLKRWGLWLTIVVNVLGGLSAAPGLVAAPNAALQAAALVGVLISVRGINLCPHHCAGSAAVFPACFGDCPPTFARKVRRVYEKNPARQLGE